MLFFKVVIFPILVCLFLGNVAEGRGKKPGRLPALGLTVLIEDAEAPLNSVCQGAIIWTGGEARKWVITSAACAQGRTEGLSLIVGTNDRCRPQDTIQVRGVKSKYTNGNGLAILEADLPFPKRKNLWPADLPKVNLVRSHEGYASITGWSGFRKGGKSCKLRWDWLPLHPTEECNTENRIFNKDQVLCAGGNGLYADCENLLGSPLMCESGVERDVHDDDDFALCGIVSEVLFTEGLDCKASRIPVISVPANLPWIRAVVNGTVGCDGEN